MTSVSVVMPVYNSEPWLVETMESLLNQTMSDFEVVALDDGSTDRSGEILDAYAARDPRVKVHHLPHRGIVGALNVGLEYANAPLIARMDADDLCHPDRLTCQSSWLDAHPDVGLVSCQVVYGGDADRFAGFDHFVDWTNRLLTHDQISLNRFVESPLIHPTVMFRRGLIERVGTYRDGDFPEDYELWLRMLDAGVMMGKIERPLVTWRERPTRLSRTDERYAIDAFYRIKTAYLARFLTASKPRKLVVWGAGRPTRRRAELLTEHGLQIAAYVDVNPNKVGQTIHGRLVWSKDDLPDPGEVFILSYVANRGARSDIQSWLELRGYRMGQDFLLVA